MAGHSRSLSRRTFLSAGAALAAGVVFRSPRVLAAPKLRVTGFELLPVRATERTVWLIVRLRTDAGLTGLGEASDAFGFANTTKQDAARMESELRAFFGSSTGQSPLDIEAVSAAGRAARLEGRSRLGDRLQRDRAGAVGSGGEGARRADVRAVRRQSRETRCRFTPTSTARPSRGRRPGLPRPRRRPADGFRAVKAAPFDGFPPPGSSGGEIEAAVEAGIACVAAMREAVGPDVEVMVDCHSFFDVALAERVARRLEPQQPRVVRGAGGAGAN